MIKDRKTAVIMSSNVYIQKLLYIMMLFGFISTKFKVGVNIYNVLINKRFSFITFL